MAATRPTGPTGTSGSADPSAWSDALVTEAATALRVEHWGKDGSRTLTGSEALEHAIGESPSRHWVDLTDPSPELTTAVARELGLHPLVAEDIEERNQRPKLELTGDHVHLVAFAIAYDTEVRTEEIDFVLGRTFLLTVHTRAWDPWTAPTGGRPGRVPGAGRRPLEGEALSTGPRRACGRSAGRCAPRRNRSPRCGPRCRMRWRRRPGGRGRRSAPASGAGCVPRCPRRPAGAAPARGRRPS